MSIKLFSVHPVRHEFAENSSLILPVVADEVRG